MYLLCCQSRKAHHSDKDTQWCLANRVVKFHRGTRSVNTEWVMKLCMKTWTISHLWNLRTVLLQHEIWCTYQCRCITQHNKQSFWSFRPCCVCCIYSFCLFVVKSKTASRRFWLVLSFSLLAVSTFADHIKGAVLCGLLMSSAPWPHQRCCSVWPANHCREVNAPSPH